MRLLRPSSLGNILLPVKKKLYSKQKKADVRKGVHESFRGGDTLSPGGRGGTLPRFATVCTPLSCQRCIIPGRIITPLINEGFFQFYFFFGEGLDAGEPTRG